MMKKYVASILTLFICTTVLAVSRTYTVHLLVFSHLTPTTVSAEQWAVLAPTPINPVTSTHPSFALSSAAKALQQADNGAYKILFEGEWQETWKNAYQTIQIPFSNGKDSQGNLSITLGHYFDVHADVLFSAPLDILRHLDTTDYFNQIDQSPFYFSLSQDRRMKSQELNYLSTPVIGVLIEMTK